MVIEYIGTIIRNEVANRKEKLYESQVSAAAIVSVLVSRCPHILKGGAQADCRARFKFERKPWLDILAFFSCCSHQSYLFDCWYLHGYETVGD